jgi:hypothetical protein
MYNFRYLLVTIVSIFVSLAIGLLLGAAIAGSDLARDTSQDMMDSLMSRLDEINTTNLDLRRELDDNNLLTTQFVNDWVDKRLDGRTVCILSSAEDTDIEAANTLQAAVERAGAATVRVQLLKGNFGLDEAQIRSRLERMVPTEDSEEYATTLAAALADEWTYSYAASASDAPTQADDNIGSKPTTPFQDTINSQYPLTRYLVQSGVLQITSNYQLLSEHQNPRLQAEQLAALRAATAWQLPYGVNAIINTLVLTQNNLTDSVGASSPPPVTTINYRSDTVALALTTEFIARGVDKTLPYPAVLRPISAGDSNAAAKSGSYFGLLAQSGNKAQTMANSARDNSLTALTSLEGETDTYNVVALLSGATPGIYGTTAADNRFTALPEDLSGRLPFAR